MTNLKFIQINIYKGQYLENLLEFLKDESPDVLALQEVSSGDVNNCPDKSLKLFSVIRDQLGMNGLFDNVVKFSDSTDSTLGNAILTRQEIIDSSVVRLKEFRSVTLAEFKDTKIWPDFSRNLLDTTLLFDGKKIHVISVHGAWSVPPVDTEEKIRQAKIIVNHLDNLNKTNQPFILGGDLNMPPRTKVIEMINQVSKNLMIGSGFQYTTHPKIHKIVPRKLLVDYIFTSRHFDIKSLKVPEVTVSDHLPIIAELELINSS